MSNLFKNLEVNEHVEEQIDSLGGVQVLETDVYPVTIEKMFVGYSASKAMYVTVQAKTKDGVDYKTTQYVTSGEDKGCKPYYIKNDKKYFLPGYNIISAICIFTTGNEIKDMEYEDKVIKLYDYDAKKELPTKVPMLVEAIGKQVALGIQKQIVDIRKKDDTTGTYLPNGETREINEIDTVFCIDTGRTLLETRADAEEPVFLSKWKEKWKGQVINKAKGLEGSTGAIGKTTPSTGTSKTKPTKSLFS